MTIRQVVEELKAEGLTFVLDGESVIWQDREERCPLRAWLARCTEHDGEGMFLEDDAVAAGLRRRQAWAIIAAADNAGQSRVRRMLLELVKETP